MLFDKLRQVPKMSQLHGHGVNNSRHFGFDRPSTNFPYTLRMIQTIKQITNIVPSSPYPNMVASYESLRDRNIVGQRNVRVCALSHVMTRLARGQFDLVGAELWFPGIFARHQVGV